MRVRQNWLAVPLSLGRNTCLHSRYVNSIGDLGLGSQLSQAGLSIKDSPYASPRLNQNGTGDFDTGRFASAVMDTGLRLASPPAMAGSPLW